MTIKELIDYLNKELEYCKNDGCFKDGNLKTCKDIKGHLLNSIPWKEILPIGVPGGIDKEFDIVFSTRGPIAVPAIKKSIIAPTINRPNAVWRL